MIRRVHPADADGVVWVTLEAGGVEYDLQLGDVGDADLVEWFRSGGLARDVAPTAVNHAVGGVLDWLFGSDGDDGWQDQWRAEVHDWIRESMRRANAWEERRRQAERAGRADLARRAIEWKTAHRELQSWMYEVIDRALGGVEALGAPIVAALPVLKVVIGGAVLTYTVHTVAAFFEDDEVKGAAFDEGLIAVAERMLESDDPAVRQKGAETIQTIADTREKRAEDDGSAVGILVGVGAVVLGIAAWRRRRELQDGARRAMAAVKRR